MVRLGVGLLLSLVIAAPAFAQSATRVEIRQGRSRAAVEPAGTEPYTGGRWASVLLVSGEARDVVETERYGASHVLVGVEPGQ